MFQQSNGRLPHARLIFKEASPKKSWLTPIEKVETIQICWQWKESISMTSFICSRGPVRFTNDVIFHVTTVNFSPLKTPPKNVALFMDIGETIISTGGFLGTRHLSVSKRFLIWAEWCLSSYLILLAFLWHFSTDMFCSTRIIFGNPWSEKWFLSRPVFLDDASLA